MDDELCSVSARSNVLHSGQRVQFSSHRTTESFTSFSHGPSLTFLQTPGVLSCAFFSRVAFVWSFSHKAWICEVLQRLVLPAGSPISAKELCSSVRVVIGFLITSVTKVLLTQLFSLVGWPALETVWVVVYYFHCWMMELTVLLGTFNTQDIVLYPSPDLCLLNSIMEFYGQFLGVHGRVSALTCTVNCGTFHRKVCFFLYHVQSI